MRLRDGLNELAAALYTLSVSLDAVVFRDTWRAVAIAAMRLLYNEIATEAQFSPEVSNQSAALLTMLSSKFSFPGLVLPSHQFNQRLRRFEQAYTRSTQDPAML